MKKIASLTLIAIIIASILFSCGTKSTDDFYLVKQTYTDKSGTTTYEFFYNEEYRIIKRSSPLRDSYRKYLSKMIQMAELSNKSSYPFTMKIPAKP